MNIMCELQLGMTFIF